MKTVINGALYSIKGLGFVTGKPKLWKFLAMPVLINIISFAISVWLVWIYKDTAISYIWVKPSGDAWWVIPLVIVWGFYYGLAFLLMLSMAFVLIYGISGIIATPFNDLLTEKVEEMVLKANAMPFTFKIFVVDVWRSIRHSVLNLILYLAGLIMVFVIGFIPIIGQVLFVPLQFYSDSLFFNS